MDDYALFLDDIRHPPRTRENWVLCRTLVTMCELLEERGIPSLVSFDYELGRTDPGHSGEDAVISFLGYLLSNPPDEPLALEVRLHTSSSYGAARMAALLQKNRAACEELGIRLIYQ